MVTFDSIKKRGPTVVRRATATAGGGHPVDRSRVRHILGATRMQPKLTVNPPNDSYEQEANRVADAVLRMPDPIAGEQQLQRQQVEELEKVRRQPAEEPFHMDNGQEQEGHP